MDKGPWLVEDRDGDIALQSDDFNYDVRIKFTGDFGSHETMLKYAHWLANKLNGAPHDPA